MAFGMAFSLASKPRLNVRQLFRTVVTITPPMAMAHIRPADFDYVLPADRIAIHPTQRGKSRMLVVHPTTPRLLRGAATEQDGDGSGPAIAIDDRMFEDLPGQLPLDAHLVLNQSQVIPARLFLDNGGGTATEVFLLAPLQPSEDPAAALAAGTGNAVWKCMVRDTRCKAGDRLAVRSGDGAGVVLRAEVLTIDGGWHEPDEGNGVECDVRFSWAPAGCGGPAPGSLGEVLEKLGEVPLPPYLRRESMPSDIADYQTVFSDGGSTGSVAAPTAGLHFTEPILAALEAAGTRTSTLALHVGAGTFKPVEAGTLGRHSMHRERVVIETASMREVAASIEAGRPIVPVGTTALRAIESAYWLGARLLKDGGQTADTGGESVDPAAATLNLGQWEAYQYGGLPSKPADALVALANHVEGNGGHRLAFTTELCIAPGYSFACVDYLVTNFHQPQSTLLLLVAALLGGQPATLHAVYNHALDGGYRFLSYGDCMLLARTG